MDARGAVGQRPSEQSAFVDGLAIQLLGGDVGPAFSADGRIIYGLIAESKPWPTIFFPKDEYFCIAKMKDAHGRDVSRRIFGPNPGRHFISLDQPFAAKLRMFQATDGRIPVLEYLHPYGSGLYFYSPDQLFLLEEPGTYKLTLQFQVFKAVSGNGAELNLELVRFPPLEVLVVKNYRDAFSLHPWTFVYGGAAFGVVGLGVFWLISHARGHATERKEVTVSNQ